MRFRHQIGRSVKGHPLLWLAVLIVGACGSFWNAFRQQSAEIALANQVGFWGKLNLIGGTIFQCIVGIGFAYWAARVAAHCVRVYRQHGDRTPVSATGAATIFARHRIAA
jgi:hypothetical protein